MNATRVPAKLPSMKHQPSIPASALLLLAVLTIAALLVLGFTRVTAQQPERDFTPVTDAMLQDPDPADWLMWRRTLNSWGFSPLDQIDRTNVASLRMVWTRPLGPGLQQGTPLVYDGAMYMPNPRDIIQAIDAATGDLIWEHRRTNAGRSLRLHDRQPDRHQP